jgi:hypothetical protein
MPLNAVNFTRVNRTLVPFRFSWSGHPARSVRDSGGLEARPTVGRAV